MNGRLTPTSRTDFIKKMRSLGWEGPRPGTRHERMFKDDQVLIIPNEHAGDISVGLLRRLLAQASISREEWLKAR